MHILEFHRIVDTLPAAFAIVAAEARAEGYQSLDRLTKDWVAGTMRFDRPGEALLAAWQAGTLAGIGGLTLDPVVPGGFRMRRFYIRPVFRRQGIARSLAVALLEMPCLEGQTVMVNAGASEVYAFWESLGFTPDPQHEHTHVKALRLARALGAG